jgi:hypothetical protein
MQLNDYIFSGDCSVTRLNSDSGTPQELNLMKISRQDGAKLISSNFAPKEITIGGILKGDTISDLELNIDTFKKAVMITNGNLDMDYAGSYRRYKVDCSACTISREYYNVTFAPFEVKFICSDPPFSKDISAIGGTDILNDVYSAENITSESVTNSFTVDGSAIPKGKIQYKFDAIGDIGSFDFINLSTSKQLNISTAFTSGDEILIDHDNMSVSLNGEPVEFDGVFPDLKLGSNSFESNMYLSSGTTLDASQTTNNSQKPFYGAIKLAQSFQVSTSALIPKIQLLLRKVGAITSDISFRIETNETDKPSGTAVASGTATILASSVNTSAFWININLADCELSAETTYWIVLSTTNGSSEDYYEWRSNNLGGYAGGNGARYFSSWDSLSWDFCFKVYKNIIDQNNSTETPESVTENFSATTYKDSTTDFYSETNNNYNWPMGEPYTDPGSVAQSFHVSANKTLLTATFYLKKDTGGSPTGNAVAKLYSHTGTYGTSSKPDTLLATSDNFDTSSLTEAYSLITFTFSGANQYSLISGTNYVIVLSYYVGGDNDYFYIGADNSSPTHGGNLVSGDDREDTTWTAFSSYDLCFYINNATTADWNTTQGKLLLNGTSPNIDTTNNIGQSLALDTSPSSIVSATLTKSDTTPSGTSIAYTLSSDGTNFETVTPSSEKYFTNIGSALKFKATLTGTTTATPEIDTLNIAYKLGALINATTHRVAQSFVAGFTGNLGRIKLNVKKFGAPGNLTAYIYSNSAGVPDSLLATQEYTGSILSDQFGWISINFNTPASLTDGTTYWIVLAASGVDSSNGYLIRSRTGNIYTNGTLKYSTNSGTDYTEYTGEDILFQTYASSGLQHQFDMRIQYNKRWL